MLYPVKVLVKPGHEEALLQAIAEGTTGQGSIAGDEYVCGLQQARGGDGARWPGNGFTRKYFDLLSVEDTHNHQGCQRPAMRWH
jgi:hypothetical protein